MLLRAGLWLLTAVTMFVGVVATLLPHAFYRDVPWVALDPPYSEHLMRDYGAMNLALALVIAVAVVTMHPLLVRAALGAFLVFAVPHLIFHATHLNGLTTGAAVTELVALSIAGALPAFLLALTRTTRRARPSSPNARSKRHGGPG